VGRGEVSAVARGRQLTAARRAPAAGSPALQLLPSARSLLAGFGLLAAAFALYVGARETSVFAVRSIDVTTESSGRSQVAEQALAPLAGTSLVQIDEAAIRRRLASLPHVHLVSYDRSFPDGLRVRVSVERAVAVLRRASENWLVSAEGRVLRRLERRLRRPLPVVWVPRGAEPEVGALLRAEGPARAVSALGAMRTSKPGFLRRLWYVEEREDGLTVVLRDRVELRLGEATDLALKLEVARRVLAELHDSEATASYIDASVPSRAVAGTTLNSEVEP
jgi:cell division septal protein FtsQ